MTDWMFWMLSILYHSDVPDDGYVSIIRSKIHVPPARSGTWGTCCWQLHKSFDHSEQSECNNPISTIFIVIITHTHTSWLLTELSRITEQITTVETEEQGESQHLSELIGVSFHKLPVSQISVSLCVNCCRFTSHSMPMALQCHLHFFSFSEPRFSL